MQHTGSATNQEIDIHGLARTGVSVVACGTQTGRTLALACALRVELVTSIARLSSSLCISSGSPVELGKWAGRYSAITSVGVAEPFWFGTSSKERVLLHARWLLGLALVRCVARAL